MANKGATFVVGKDGVAVASWTGITEADTGLPVNMARFPDRTVQVLGDFTTSGAVTIEGSNDGGVTYFTLTDPTGAPLVFTAAGGKLIVENPEKMRPRATAGTSVSMDVYICGAPR